ncbi:MAG: FliH/SctL family protein [Acidimicrobiales bacterium]
MSAESTGNQLLLRGRVAETAKAIDLAVYHRRTQTDHHVAPTGPWAAEADETYEQARDAGIAEGRRQGFEQGRSEGLGAARAELASALAALDAAGRRFADLADKLDRQAAAQATALALEIAAAVVGGHVAAAADPGAEAIARCLAVAPAEGEVTVRLHPEDVAVLGRSVSADGRPLTIVADPRLGRGDAVVTVDDTMIDGRLDHALERVTEVLR